MTTTDNHNNDVNSDGLLSSSTSDSVKTVNSMNGVKFMVSMYNQPLEPILNCLQAGKLKIS